MLRLLTALLLLLVPAACATKPVASEKLSGIKTVGIVSALENEFSFKTIGFMVFGNEERRALIDVPLGVDDLIVERMTQLLGGRYDVRPVTYRKAEFPPDRLVRVG